MAFEQEAAFEAALINLLTEKYGWEPEILRYKTEEDLIQNWKHILFENNRDVDRLNDIPLTDGRNAADSRPDHPSAHALKTQRLHQRQNRRDQA